MKRNFIKFLLGLAVIFPCIAKAQHWDGVWLGDFVCSGTMAGKRGYSIRVWIKVENNEAVISRATTSINWLGIKGQVDGTGNVTMAGRVWHSNNASNWPAVIHGKFSDESFEGTAFEGETPHQHNCKVSLTPSAPAEGSRAIQAIRTREERSQTEAAIKQQEELRTRTVAQSQAAPRLSAGSTNRKFDGIWAGLIDCSAPRNRRDSGYADYVHVEIKSQGASIIRSTGRIREHRATILEDGRAVLTGMAIGTSSGTWPSRFEGTFSAETFYGKGYEGEGDQFRDCSVELNAIEPAPGSLASELRLSKQDSPRREPSSATQNASTTQLPRQSQNAQAAPNAATRQPSPPSGAQIRVTPPPEQQARPAQQSRTQPHAAVAQSAPEPTGGQNASSARSTSSPPANPALVAAASAGAADDLILVVNLADNAPNAAIDIDGNITFRTTRSETCRISAFADDIARATAVEGWFAERNIDLTARSVATCDGKDFSKIDVGITLRKDARSLGFASDQIGVVVVESVAARQTAERARLDARDANAAAITAGRPGTGYLVFNSQTDAVCLLSGEIQRTWTQLTRQQTGELAADLGARISLRPVNTTPNEAYIAARRGECRLVVGAANDLLRFRAAAQRDRIAHQVGAVWIAPLPVEAPRTQAAASTLSQSVPSVDAIREILGKGSPEDMLLLINVSTTAPSAARDLDDNTVFRSPEALLCRQTDFSTDLAATMAAERWLAARNLKVDPTSLPSCVGRVPRKLDGALLQRKDLATLEPRALEEWSALAREAVLDVAILQSADERRAAERSRAQARRTTAQKIDAMTDGVGYLVMEKGADAACFASGSSHTAWQSSMPTRFEELHLDLSSRANLRPLVSDANNAFISARRGDCRVVVGESADLARIAAAAERNRVPFRHGAFWLDGHLDQGGGSVLARPGGTPRQASPFLTELDMQGHAGDLLLLVNVSSRAPNASLNLAGNIVFLSSKAVLCTAISRALNLEQELALRRWMSERTVVHDDVLGTPCGDREFAVIDAIVVRRGELARLPARLFNAVANQGAARNVAASVVITDDEIRRNETAREAARTVNLSNIENGRPGTGMVIFENRSTTICVAAEGQIESWRRVVVSSASRLALDLDLATTLQVVDRDIDAAFLEARRGSCRAIIGTASQLAPVLTAAARDSLAARPGAVWFAPGAADEAAAVLRAERDAVQRQAEMARQQAEAERKLAEQRDRELGIERARRTESLRNASRARAATFIDQTRTGLRESLAATPSVLLDEARDFWVRTTGFRETFSLITRLRSEKWEFEELEMEMAEFGLGQWQGRKLDTGLMRVTIRLRNRDVGRYQTLCLFLGYQIDAEFGRTRAVHETNCSPDGQARSANWLAGLGYESQWNARP
jgi:hypothetical protein